MSKYRFLFCDGTFYLGEIVLHTIKEYTLDVFAKDDNEAIEKINKKRFKFAIYNRVFLDNMALVTIYKKNKMIKTGIIWFRFDNPVIKWENEFIYNRAPFYPFKKLNKLLFKAPEEDYISRKFLVNALFSGKIPSYGYQMDIIYEHCCADGKSFSSRSKEDALKTFNEIYIEQINKLKTSNDLTQEEKDSIIQKNPHPNAYFLK